VWWKLITRMPGSMLVDARGRLRPTVRPSSVAEDLRRLDVTLKEVFFMSGAPQNFRKSGRPFLMRNLRRRGTSGTGTSSTRTIPFFAVRTPARMVLGMGRKSFSRFYNGAGYGFIARSLLCQLQPAATHAS